MAIIGLCERCGEHVCADADEADAESSSRPMLFAETAALAEAAQTRDIPKLVLCHHLIVRSGVIPLPHQMHSWQESEYVKFVCEHSNAENMRLVEAALKSWEESAQADASEEAKECARILQVVLNRDK